MTTPFIATLDGIRAQLKARPNVWDHAVAVVDAIEERAEADPQYREQLDLWLSTFPAYSTVHLRDVLFEPLKVLPNLIEISKQFNPTTEWHNMWMPLDAAIHRERHGIEPDDI